MCIMFAINKKSKSSKSIFAKLPSIQMIDSVLYPFGNGKYDDVWRYTDRTTTLVLKTDMIFNRTLLCYFFKAAPLQPRILSPCRLITIMAKF